MSAPSAPSATTPDAATTDKTAEQLAREPREHAAPSTAVTRVEPLDARIRYAQTIAAAGTLLPRGLRDGINPRDEDALAARVFLITETGNMLGIHPVAALQGVNIIEGTPSISPALMTALVRRAGHKVRTRVEGSVADGTIKAVCQVIRADDPDWPFVSEWNLERAERAGLVTVKRDERTGRTSVHARSKSGKILPWEAYTEAMLKARAIGETCREAAEDALMGVHYVPEEIGGHVNEAGELIGEVVDDGPHAPAASPARPHAPAAPAEESGPAATPPQDEGAALLEHVYGLLRVATDAAALAEAWNAGVTAYAQTSMAASGAKFGDWAASVHVDVHGRKVTLRDLFAELGDAAKAAAASQNRPEEPSAAPGPQDGGGDPGNGPHAPVYAHGAEDDVVDAEVEADPIPPAAGTEYGVPGRGGYTVRDGVDDADPWADGSASSRVPEPGVEAVASILGGEVVDVEGEGVTDNEVRHEQAKARAASGRKGPTNTPPKESTGRAAVEAAKEEVRRKQREAAERGE